MKNKKSIKKNIFCPNCKTLMRLRGTLIQTDIKEYNCPECKKIKFIENKQEKEQ